MWFLQHWITHTQGKWQRAFQSLVISHSICLMLKDVSYYSPVYMKKQQENSTHKNNSALFCKSIYFKSPVFRNSLSLNSQVFRHSHTLYLVGGDHGLAFRKNLVIPKSHCESGHFVWALTRRLAREVRQTVLSTLGGESVNTTDCVMR